MRREFSLSWRITMAFVTMRPVSSSTEIAARRIGIDIL
jgi:hypothetical protein